MFRFYDISSIHNAFAVQFFGEKIREKQKPTPPFHIRYFLKSQLSMLHDMK